MVRCRFCYAFSTRVCSDSSADLRHANIVPGSNDGSAIVTRTQHNVVKTKCSNTLASTRCHNTAAVPLPLKCYYMASLSPLINSEQAKTLQNKGGLN